MPKVYTSLDSIPGAFYEIGDGFFLPTAELKAGTAMLIDKLPLGGMFDIFICSIDKVRVGFYFVSRFPTENHGGFIVAYLSKKREATITETLIRNDDLVVYNFPNRGTLAICPTVNSEVSTIFEEQ